jgi:hypothetical protein
MARKPLSEGSVAGNVLKWECGGLNIDSCRVPYEEGGDAASNPMVRRARGCKTTSNTGGTKSIWGHASAQNEIGNDLGRYPANLILQTGGVAAELDLLSGQLKSSRYFKRVAADE